MLAAAVAKHLASTVVGLTFDATGSTGNVFVEFMPATPDVAIMVSGQPGQPLLTHSAAAVPGIQILVRGAAGDPRPSHALAVAVFAELACLDGTTLDNAGADEVWLIGCSSLQSEPTSIGQDVNQRSEWSLNFTCRIHTPTLHRI